MMNGASAVDLAALARAAARAGLDFFPPTGRGG